MMEFGMGTIILVLVLVWYLGSTINNVLGGAGDLASKEFKGFSQEQDLRLRKQQIKRHKAVEKIKDDPVYTDTEWDVLFQNKDADE